jgi:two-component system chemotaxis sensor kinase CheA
MDELLSEFLTETNESLGYLDLELVKLEQNPNDPELLGNIFRLMHTIKGTCGFLGLPRLESVAHAGENVLGKVRDGELEASTDAVTLILECLDRIREILSVLEQTESEPEGNDAGLIERLNALAEGGGAPAAASGAVASEAEIEMPEVTDEAEAAAEPAAEDAPETAEEAEDEPLEAVGETDAAPPPAPAPVKAKAKPGKAKAPAAAPKDAAVEGQPEALKESSVANQSIRVNVDVLENLMTMVSELVLTRNQLLQILRSQRESEFAAPLQQLNHVVSELQDGVMQTRMQPIGNAWAKLPRIIRDLSHELGKKIDLVMKGAETELDRQVLDLIKDPLTHMVRNSADHGLEMPEDRSAAGKSETGTIILHAYHEGGHIIIQISDDGKGLPIDKIKQKVLDNNLASEAEIEAMSDQQIQQFIFKAGFSTAAAVTSVSGRGVGMDVVRTNIEKIGGTIELNSIEGKGTRFTIKIPLTLAIVSALIVECGGERFAIPQLSVVELVRASANSEHTIERINDTPVLRLRNRLLPLVNLREHLRLAEPGPKEVAGEPEAKDAKDAQRDPAKDGFIVVAQVGTYNFGIIVDRVFDTEEIVVKPVAPILRNIALFSGNTILGDGSVVMILDPNGIAAATGEISVTEANTDAATEKRAAHAAERVAMLVFRAVVDAPKAVPLALVARLEEIDLTKVEQSNGQSVVQYRGQLMPLIQMEGAKPIGKEGRQAVLVFADGERSMGLVVDEIVDIVEESLNIELTADREGYVGSAVVDGRATDIIDAGYYLTMAFKDWFGSERSSRDGDKESRILLVDDSPFFRNLLSPLLSVAGYEVVTAASASEAMNLCEAGEDFDIIISDIEMPGMNGFEFAEAVRTSSRWSDTPIVALSSHASPKDLARGRNAGFRDYVAKFDRDGLLNTLTETLAEMRGAA